MEKLTVKEAKEYVSKIKSIASDDESAHSLEDSFRENFIKCVAKGLYEDISEAQQIAKIVYSTNKIEFSRWYA